MARVYRPRHPERTVLYRVLHHFDRFLAEYEDRIIDHLKITFVADKPPPPEAAFQEYLMAADPPAEYFS